MRRTTLTEEHKNRISEAHQRLSLLGNKNFKHTDESKKKIGDSCRKYPLLNNKGWLIRKYVKEMVPVKEIAKESGCPHIPDVYQALRKFGIKPRGHVRGSKHWQWKGGVSDERTNLPKTKEYKIWRKSVYERDDYICQSCGQRGGKLEPHHILPVRDFWQLRFAINNGMTLCKKCHKKTIRREYLFIQAYYVRGELLGNLKILLSMAISSQDSKGISSKVQRLEDETRNVGNSSTSALPEREDIVRTIRKLIEVLDKEPAR